MITTLLAALAFAAAEPQPAAKPLDAMLADFPYPYEVERRELRSQEHDLSLAYMDVEPEAPNGRVVVLLHGKNFSGAYWKDTIAPLTKLGFRVIAPDQIGFGKSSKPRPYHYSLGQMAEQTHALLESLDVQRATLVGHSMGGMLAIRYALQYPAEVEKLALVNPIGLEDWRRHVPYRSVDALYRQELEAPVDASRRYMRTVYFGGDWKPAYEPLVAIQEGWARGPDRDLTSYTAAVTTEMLIAQPVVYELGDLAMPVLLVIGQRDTTALGKAWASEAAKAKLGNYPALGRKVRDAIRDATLVEIDDAGHVPQADAFDAYWKALADFLE